MAEQSVPSSTPPLPQPHGVQAPFSEQVEVQPPREARGRSGTAGRAKADPRPSLKCKIMKNDKGQNRRCNRPTKIQTGECTRCIRQMKRKKAKPPTYLMDPKVRVRVKVVVGAGHVAVIRHGGVFVGHTCSEPVKRGDETGGRGRAEEEIPERERERGRREGRYAFPSSCFLVRPANNKSVSLARPQIRIIKKQYNNNTP